VVADRRHAAETTIADAALRDAAVKRLRRDGKRGDGSPLFPRSSFLAAVFLISAPAVQDRVHDSLTLYTEQVTTLDAARTDITHGYGRAIWVTAPSEADETSAAYLAKTPAA
jgi:hypothetical protein